MAVDKDAQAILQISDEEVMTIVMNAKEDKWKNKNDFYKNTCENLSIDKYIELGEDLIGGLDKFLYEQDINLNIY